MRPWLAGVLALVVGLVAGGAVVFAFILPTLTKPVGTVTESRDTQVIQAIERQEEVVLVSLGIQGIAEESAQGTILGQRIPGTGRTQFLQYNYRALLGIDGADVVLTRTGEDTYLVSIPAFEFIGYDDVSFKTALENNGILSWVTPEIDTAAVITELLDDDAKREHVDANRDLLQDQAENFYRGIILGVSPDAKVTFRFGSTR